MPIPLIYVVDSDNLETLARRYQVDDVAGFLTEIGLPQYSETFRRKEISGDVLLKASPVVLSALSVKSLEHQTKITQQFVEKLKGSTMKGM